MNKIKKKSLIFLILLVVIGFNFKIAFGLNFDENFIFELKSDKQEYTVGEEINFEILIDNKLDFDIFGQIRGKIIIGDIGFEIECFEGTLIKKQISNLALTPIKASLSGSNQKQMSTIYSCDGRSMQSSKTQVTNTPISKTGEEVYSIEPFELDFTYNNTKQIIKSNSLSITVKSSEEKEEEKEENEEGEEQEEDKQDKEQNEQNDKKQQEQQQNPQTQPNQNSQLNQKQQSSVTNNQQNANSINQLKQEIEKAKKDLPQTDEEKEKAKSYFWQILFLILVFILGAVLIYYKYFSKQEIVEIEEKKIVPQFLILLNKVSKQTDNKKKAKLLSQSIREFIIAKNSLNSKLTNNEAQMYTTNKLFLEILEKANKIEFANKNIKIDYILLVKKLRQEFKKLC